MKGTTTATVSTRAASSQAKSRTSPDHVDQPDTSPTAVIYMRARAAGKTPIEGVVFEDRLIEAQRRRCMATADRMRITVIEQYVDLGDSASDMGRPQLVVMLERLKTKGDVDYVIVDTRDRLTRSMQDTLALMQTFEANSVRLVVAQEASQATDTSPANEFLQATLELAHEFASRDRSEAAKQGWATRRARRALKAGARRP